jgi:hypothetical protein
MGRFYTSTFQFSLAVPPPGTPGLPVASINAHPPALSGLGCNMLVEIATASAFVSNPAAPAQRRSIQVWAHLDTGANPTSISLTLAQHLSLVPTGVSQSQTAAGPVTNPSYAVDLVFLPPSTLAPRLNLAVGSCVLPFNLVAHQATPTVQQNFAVLIGRDVMTAWHMTWDGLSASVVISD